MARPVSVLKPSIVFKLPEDSGSKVSLASLEDMISFLFFLESFFMHFSGADSVAPTVTELS